MDWSFVTNGEGKDLTAHRPLLGTRGEEKGGCQKKTWRQTVEKELQESGVSSWAKASWATASWAKASTVAYDRDRWREMIFLGVLRKTTSRRRKEHVTVKFTEH